MQTVKHLHKLFLFLFVQDPHPGFLMLMNDWPKIVRNFQTEVRWFYPDHTPIGWVLPPACVPPLHVHYKQEETLHVLKGRYKVRIGDEIYHLEEGGFAYMPSKIPHAFLNLTDQPGEIIVVYTPGGGHKFYEEFGPIARMGHPDPKVIAPLFLKYDMELLGPPLTPD